MTVSQIAPSITNTISTTERVTAQQAHQTAKPTPSPAANTDTVQLSNTAQVLSLRHQGYSPQKIANETGDSRQTVERMLNVHHSKKKV